MTSIVGIAGTSRLSVPVLRRLRDTGHDARGFLPRAATSEAENATGDADDFTSGLKTLVVLATDIAETEDLLFETHALVSRAETLERIVICGTLTPRYVRALRHRIPERIAVIDAPVAGTPRQAGEGRLTFLVGGSAQAVAGAEPILSALARRVERMGALGAGTSAKVLRDFLSASSAAMTRLALDWAEAQGLDEPKLLTMLEATPARSLISAEFDGAEYALDNPAADDTVTALVRDVEGALDCALQDAHLTPPGALRDAFRNLRARALH